MALIIWTKRKLIIDAGNQELIDLDRQARSKVNGTDKKQIKGYSKGTMERIQTRSLQWILYNPEAVKGILLGVMPFWIKKTLQKERPKRGLIV
jgi:hypothetical protein